MLCQEFSGAVSAVEHAELFSRLSHDAEFQAEVQERPVEALAAYGIQLDPEKLSGEIAPVKLGGDEGVSWLCMMA